MKLFKYINQAGGIFAALFFLVMVSLVRRGIIGKAYYAVGTLFLIFSAMFIPCCVIIYTLMLAFMFCLLWLTILQWAA